MGAYLSEPDTDKYSSDEANDYMDVGASSMQGWRISQEDAHNCILNYDEKTSFFAVYDGHGGAEVATYCAEKLPEFLKNLKAYKDKDFELALKDAFLGFDATLLQEDVIEILKKLAGEKNPNRDSELAEEEEEEDLAELCQEGALPLDQVLEKYKGCAAKFPQLNKLKNEEAGASGSGTSKPLSPFLRGRRIPVADNVKTISEGPSSSSSFAGILTSEKMDADAEDSTVSSSSCSKSECSKADAKLNAACTVQCSSPDSSSVKSSANSAPAEKIQNGDITSYQESEVTKSENVSSSSTSSQVPKKHENGEVSSLSSTSEHLQKPRLITAGVAGNISSSTTEAKQKVPHNSAVPGAEDSSSSDDDADFHAEENSSTEDGEEDCEPCEDETEDENEDEDTEEEDSLLDDGFCTNMIEEPGKDSGCTAVVALLHGRDLYVANAGDSRCVVCRKGKAVEMSLDHKPEDEEECARIFKAGGKVTLDGRVNGGLNLSRAIGDHAYKMNKDLAAEKQMISALPDVRKLIISSDDEFMVLACDGIWNFMSSEDVVEFVKKRISEGVEKMSSICEELFDNCLAPNTTGDGTGCDNMTAVIIRFKPDILKLQTRISEESEALPVTGTSKRRCTSPTSQTECDGSNENSTKRLKTDDHADKECDSGGEKSKSLPVL